MAQSTEPSFISHSSIHIKTLHFFSLVLHFFKLKSFRVFLEKINSKQTILVERTFSFPPLNFSEIKNIVERLVKQRNISKQQHLYNCRVTDKSNPQSLINVHHHLLNSHKNNVSTSSKQVRHE